MSPVVVLFRRDLRLADHPALTAAAASGAPVIPLYVWDDRAAGRDAKWATGSAQQWWIHHSLASLAEALAARGSKLTLRRGDASEEIAAVVADTGAKEVFWSHRYEPDLAMRDRSLRDSLSEIGVGVKAFGGALLHDPDQIRTGEGNPYRVFTPFYKRFQSVVEVNSPLAAPRALAAPSEWPESVRIDDLGLLPTINWADGFVETGTPGEGGAGDRIAEFVSAAVADYADGRDALASDATSRLSPHLALGELSPRQVWQAAQTGAGADAGSFLRQLVWREFAYHVLHHNPASDRHPLRSSFEAFPWADDDAALQTWQRGQTGYPIVDAAMRQLWTTGWMHNRARMVVASFLTKHLRIHWLRGAEWFWDTLVDADLANNSMGWQWSAGSGADAQPYFRVFNPILQGKKFDPDGAYVKRWLPKLSSVPTKYVHEPWKADAATLRRSGVVLGSDYPKPIVDHPEARKAALAAYQQMRG